MKFAKYLFYFAGGYGVLLLPPLYFMERRIGQDTPPAITHPEYFYGFVGVALACQVMFLIIGSDPVRFRPLMIAAMIEKFSFTIPVALLYQAGRVSTGMLMAGIFDGVLGILFIVAFVKTGREKKAMGTAG